MSSDCAKCIFSFDKEFCDRGGLCGSFIRRSPQTVGSFKEKKETVCQKQ